MSQTEEELNRDVTKRFDGDRVLYVTAKSDNNEHRKGHVDKDCGRLKVSDGYRILSVDQIGSLFNRVELCKKCDPEYDVNNARDSNGSKSKLEMAMENDEVPEELL